MPPLRVAVLRGSVRCKTDVALRTGGRPDVEEDVERRRKVAGQFGGVLKYSGGRELLLA